MLKVLFYTQNRWAFGSVHTGLIKELYKLNVYANLLDWSIAYTKNEFELLNKKYDIFVTQPDGVHVLHTGGIPYNKIITIAHGQWDLLLAIQNNKSDFFNELKNYCVISKILQQKSYEFGITRIPNITPIGIHFDSFYSKISNKLSVVGYAGQKECFNFYKQEIKRANLITQAVSNINDITFMAHEHFNFLCMPGYYENIDCLIMASTEEAGGLPVMEAAAAGRLVMGTYVGYFEDNADKGGGIGLPTDAASFIKKTKEHLIYYRDNPIEYRYKCQSIQQYAKENYDWNKVINFWLEIFL